MVSDGDKIAAATLAAELMRGAAKGHGEQSAIELYGDLLKQITSINPETGRPFTHEEIQRLRKEPQGRAPRENPAGFPSGPRQHRRR